MCRLGHTLTAVCRGHEGADAQGLCSRHMGEPPNPGNSATTWHKPWDGWIPVCLITVFPHRRRCTHQ